MRTGALIGIPLTLLQVGVQVGVHHHLVDPAAALNNVAVACAVYDADRIDAPWNARARLPSRLAAIASAAYYASDPATAWVAPAVVALHAGYTPCKPLLAPAKPFVVGAFWTLAVYYAPLLRAHLPVLDDVLVPASVFLSLSGLSHALDLADVEEDVAAGVRTPAVLLGEEAAAMYALALVLASSLLHTLSPSPCPLYDALSLAALGGVLTGRTAPAAAVGVALALASARAHDVELASYLLRGSDGVHEWAIVAATDAAEAALRLPPPYDRVAVDSLFHAVRSGDAGGSWALQAFEKAVRRRL